MSYNIADVQGVQGVSGASLQALPAFTRNPVAGDLIVVCCSSFDSTAGTTHAAPTDTGGNTYTQVGSTKSVNVAGTTKLSMWFTVVVTGGSSFVVTLHGTSTLSQLSGAAWLANAPLASPYNGDTAQVGPVTGSNPNSGNSTLNPPPAASLFIGCMANSSIAAVTNGTGWNNLTPDYGITPAKLTASTWSDNSTAQDLFTVYAIDGAVRAANWTEVSDTYAAIVASFAPASPSSPGGGLVDDRWRARPSTPFTQANAVLNLQRTAYGNTGDQLNPAADARADYFTRKL